MSSRSVEANNVEDYLNPKIKNILPDPYILHDMEIATNRIVEIIKAKKKIGIFGDYDVDGSTSTRLLSKYLREAGVEFNLYSYRIKEGYGPNEDALQS